ncbi:MAG: hypothetical protein JKY08_11075 [Flavobacteriaceae bacterium]|nr:hypothetical protein [Flavobacteriaceae bacterium]
MKKKYLLGALLLLFIGNGFSQSASSHVSMAKRSYGSGDYVSASFSAVAALRIKPKKKKAQEILSFSYELAQESIIESIDDLKAASKFFEGRRTVEQREDIVSLYKEVKKLDRKVYEISKIVRKPKFNILFDRIDVKTAYQESIVKLEEAKEEAAEMYYSKGLNWMKKEDRESFKRAAKAFKIAQIYIPNYKQSRTLYSESRKNGTTRIAIFAFDNKSRTSTFGAIAESVSDKLTADLFKNRIAMEFTEIVSRDELGAIMSEHKLNMSADLNQNSVSQYGELLGVHIIITGKITQVSAEHQRTIRDNPYSVSKNVVIGTKSYINKKGKARTKNVYGDVFASIYECNKTSKAILSGSFKVLDVKTGRVLSQDQFNQDYVWENKWFSYKGDERAINYSRYRGYDRSEKNPPTDFEMGNILVEQLTKKMAITITNLLK